MNHKSLMFDCSAVSHLYDLLLCYSQYLRPLGAISKRQFHYHKRNVIHLWVCETVCVCLSKNVEQHPCSHITNRLQASDGIQYMFKCSLLVLATEFSSMLWLSLKLTFVVFGFNVSATIEWFVFKFDILDPLRIDRINLLYPLTFPLLR